MKDMKFSEETVNQMQLERAFVSKILRDAEKVSRHRGTEVGLVVAQTLAEFSSIIEEGDHRLDLPDGVVQTTREGLDAVIEELKSRLS